MGRDYFAQMSRQTSHRHDQPYDSEVFNKHMGAICGMLYSVVTLKAFFPPRQKTSDPESENKITKA
jgi:hypothetical protein